MLLPHSSILRSTMLFSAVVAVTCAAQAPHVIAPNASYIDITARRVELRHATSPRVLQAVASLPSCVSSPVIPAPSGRILIPHHYLSGSHGPSNPAEAEATRPYNAFERRIAAGMNQFVANGSHTEAACAQQQIDLWAQANALYDYDAKESSQAWFQVEWTLSSIAISESILVNDTTLPRATTQADIAWMNRVAHRMIDFEKTSPGLNNHHYWRGLAATATGVLSSDDTLFAFGINTFHDAVNDIDPHGAFPLEMQRHERSLSYQGFALQPLIPLAEFAERQHVDLYAYTSSSGRTIHDASRFLLAAANDPSLIRQYTAEPQAFNPKSTDFFSFGDFYLNRFPGTPIASSLAGFLQQPAYTTRIGGSTTVLVAPSGKPPHV